ncbi:MAG: hypothetical protein LBV29_00690, partial [Azoarcus sp.]|nr:hypothetical protein [Azoarcus sp.]
MNGILGECCSRGSQKTRRNITSQDHLPIQEAVEQGRTSSAKNKTVAVIPVYNHGETVGDVVTTLRGYGLPVILVDDGSD